MDEQEIKAKLTQEEYRVLREKGTEAPFSGKYFNKTADGTYACKVCGSPLFHTDAQEDANNNPPGLAGWPSFNDAIPGAITMQPDTSSGMQRTEIVCATCGSHLGHLFDDPGTKTGKHYCLNSVCLDLMPEEGKA